MPQRAAKRRRRTYFEKRVSPLVQLPRRGVGNLRFLSLLIVVGFVAGFVFRRARLRAALVFGRARLHAALVLPIERRRAATPLPLLLCRPRRAHLAQHPFQHRLLPLLLPNPLFHARDAPLRPRLLSMRRALPSVTRVLDVPPVNLDRDAAPAVLAVARTDEEGAGPFAQAALEAAGDVRVGRGADGGRGADVVRDWGRGVVRGGSVSALGGEGEREDARQARNAASLKVLMDEKWSPNEGKAREFGGAFEGPA